MFKYYKLGIISTHKCNQTCYYCNNYDINYNSNDIINIDLDYLKYSLDLFNRNGINNLYIEISGGEPGLISNIHELIEMLYSLKYIKKIDILSNGLIRKNHSLLLNEYKLLTCIEHPCLNINNKTINYFYDDITFFNNNYDNINQLLVLDEITIDSLINYFDYYKELGLFDTNNIYFKIITPKTSVISEQLRDKYNIFYDKLKNIYNTTDSFIFTDYVFINRKISNNIKNVCSKISSMQFIDLDSKKIGLCSMDIDKSEYFDINDSTISKTIKGLLFNLNDSTSCCSNCIKYDTNAINILLDRYKYTPEIYNIIE